VTPLPPSPPQHVTHTSCLPGPPRALTVRQPWATAITHEGKDVENRTWSTNIRGRLLIHAAASPDRAAGTHPAPTSHQHHNPDGQPPRGVILGTVHLVSVHHAQDCQRGSALCSAWAMPGLFHWVLATPRPLQKPVPARGALGFWTPPPTVLADPALASLLAVEG
jgi:hypothetical protein